MIKLLLSILSLCLATCLEVPAADFLGSSDEVTSLPGLHFKLHFKHYSGYLESANKSHLHYWFFESQNNSAADPVVLWLNGGPGCSSLLGALTEQGPIRISEDGNLIPNKWAWNTRTNMIFLESPAGVGFSYNDARQYKTDDKATAELNYEAVKSFFKKFPQFVDNDFYVAGESYGGVYVPTLSQKVFEGGFPKKFKGFAIGNGYLDQTLLGNSFLLFTYYHGLYDTDLWDLMVEHCCPFRQNMEQCDFVNSKLPECKVAIKKVHAKLDQSRLNWYNIYGYCNRTAGAASHALTPYQVERSFVAKNLLNLGDEVAQQMLDDPPCMNYDYVQDWINQKSVRHALHITPDSQDWAPCSQIDYTNQYKSMEGVVRQLLAAGLKGVIYNGDVDTVCNYLGDLWFSQKLGFKTVREYTPWEHNGQVAGYVKVYENFAYTTIRGSGHMVPEDRAGAAQQMFYKFLDSGN